MTFGEISRDEWGAMEPKAKLDLWSPVTRILFMYGTESKECFTKEECIEVVRELQYRDMYMRKYPDLNFNFLIGGDGNVYEGRGFLKKATLRTEFPPNSLVIGFIGDFSVKDPPEMMMDVAHDFVERYVNESKISNTWKKSFIR